MVFVPIFSHINLGQGGFTNPAQAVNQHHLLVVAQALAQICQFGLAPHNFMRGHFGDFGAEGFGEAVFGRGIMVMNLITDSDRVNIRNTAAYNIFLGNRISITV